MNYINSIFNMDSFVGEEINKNLYEECTMIALFDNYNNGNLFLSEMTATNYIYDKLFNFNMLDIGIGCGRTTNFFIDKVKHYTGIDYSVNMVSATCKKFHHADIFLKDA